MGIKPVIDSTFELEKLGEAFSHEESGAHFGKICVAV
jgi:NADPH:quinone reductase-like Zn-dependent oxidoreductase